MLTHWNYDQHYGGLKEKASWLRRILYTPENEHDNENITIFNRKFIFKWLLFHSPYHPCMHIFTIIYLHLPWKSTKCKWIYHTWIVWIMPLPCSFSWEYPPWNESLNQTSGWCYLPHWWGAMVPTCYRHQIWVQGIRIGMTTPRQYQVSTTQTWN